MDIRRLADLPLSREASDGCKGWRWSLAQSWVGYKSMLRLLYSKPGGSTLFKPITPSDFKIGLSVNRF